MIDRLPPYFKARAKQAKLYIKPYITIQKGIEQVYCKCGVPLRGWIPICADETQRQGNGTILVIRKMALAPLTSSREVLLDMSDGSAHVTIVCGDCANRKDIEFWEDVYLCDVVQWLTDGVSMELVKERFPTRVVEVRHNHGS